MGENQPSAAVKTGTAHAEKKDSERAPISPKVHSRRWRTARWVVEGTRREKLLLLTLLGVWLSASVVTVYDVAVPRGRGQKDAKPSRFALNAVVIGKWVLETYSKELDERPLATKMHTSLWLYLLSDVLVQVVTRQGQGQSSGWDFGRMIRFTWYGVFLATPVFHHWHATLDAVFSPSSAIRNAFMAAATNQFLMTPVITTIYYVFESLATGGSIRQGLLNVRRGGVKVILAAWIFWLPCDVINFSLVPLRHRILYICIVGIVWNMYFTYAVRRRPRAHESQNDLEAGEQAPAQNKS